MQANDEQPILPSFRWDDPTCFGPFVYSRFIGLRPALSLTLKRTMTDVDGGSLGGEAKPQNGQQTLL